MGREHSQLQAGLTEDGAGQDAKGSARVCPPSPSPPTSQGQSDHSTEEKKVESEEPTAV